VANAAKRGRRRGLALVGGAVPAALLLGVAVVAAVVEGDPVIAATAPLFAAWAGGVPLLAGIGAWRADADEWQRSKAVLVVVLAATVGWIGLMLASRSSTAPLGLLILPAIQGVAWAIGSMFGD
jgi:hypothetical protein